MNSSVVRFLWSEAFRTGRPIGENAAGAMPAGFAYYVTFAPAPGANRGVILNSFVLDDLNGYFDSVPHVVNWSVRQGSAQGPVLASGTANVANGENVTVQTGLAGTEPGSEPRVLVLQRMSGIEDDLALDDLDFDEMGFVTTSYNTGSLGATADGLNATGVVLNQQGAVADGADFSSYYAAQQNTAIPLLPPDYTSTAPSPTLPMPLVGQGIIMPVPAPFFPSGLMITAVVPSTVASMKSLSTRQPSPVPKFSPTFARPPARPPVPTRRWSKAMAH